MNIQEFYESTNGEMTTSVRRDLGNNLQKIVEAGALSGSEAHLLMLTLSQSLAMPAYRDYAEAKLKSLDVPLEHIQEARENAAIMGMNNIYYRFRHMIKTGQGPEIAEHYKSAGLRMTSLARPQMGKPLFELLALAVSAINGCEMCVNSHEVELRKHEMPTEKIHDAVRLAAVLKGIQSLGN